MIRDLFFGNRRRCFQKGGVIRVLPREIKLARYFLYTEASNEALNNNYSKLNASLILGRWILILSISFYFHILFPFSLPPFPISPIFFRCLSAVDARLFGEVGCVLLVVRVIDRWKNWSPVSRWAFLSTPVSFFLQTGVFSISFSVVIASSCAFFHYAIFNQPKAASTRSQCH